MDEKLFVSLVAAGSTVCGILLTQVFTLIKESIVSKREKNSLLRNKYESLAMSLSDSMYDKAKFDNTETDDIFLIIQNKSIDNIVMLSCIYFPELIECSRNYYNSYRDYVMCVLEEFSPDTGLPALMQAVKYGNGNLELSKNKLDESYKNLYNCLREYAPKYARA